MKTQKLFVVALLMSALLFGSCGQQRSAAYYDYKSKVIATELDGSYTIRAWGRARNAIDAAEQAMKTAVYDVIFNEIDFASGTAPTTTGTLRPLLLEVNAKEKYADYFNAFFAKGGDYKKYCSRKQERTLSTRYKKTEAQMQTQLTVVVYRAELRQRLIDDNILK